MQQLMDTVEQKGVMQGITNLSQLSMPACHVALKQRAHDAARTEACVSAFAVPITLLSPGNAERAGQSSYSSIIPAARSHHATESNAADMQRMMDELETKITVGACCVAPMHKWLLVRLQEAKQTADATRCQPSDGNTLRSDSDLAQLREEIVKVEGCVSALRNIGSMLD